MMTKTATAIPGDWSGLIVLCANTAWNENPICSRPLALPLSRVAPILYVDPPVSHATAMKNPALKESLEGPRLRLVAPNIVRLTPVVLPGKDRPVVTHATELLLRRAIARAVKALGGDVLATIAIAPNRYPFGVANEKLRVFWAQDDFTAEPELVGISFAVIERGVARLADAADLIVAVSPTLVDHWAERGHDAILMPNGCDAADFAGAPSLPRPADITLEAPFAVSAGRLSPRIDLGLLEAVVDRGVRLLLVGPEDYSPEDRARLDALVARPGVQWVGIKPYIEVPAYLGAAAVGLVPYADTGFNRASFPLKTPEYLAAGLPVVATDLPSLRWMNAPDTALATEPAAFAEAVVRTIAAPVDPGGVERRQAFAAEHSWDARARQLAELLGLPTAAITPA
jgi:teichuronic acid biosynthesis glycosyltransferase TuaH